MPVEFLDRFSRGSTVCHRLPARLKIVVTVAVIVGAVVLPVSMWPALGCLACLVFAAHTLAEIPVAYLARRAALFLPLVLMIAAAVPLSHGFAGGWEAAFAIVARGLVSFMAALWLVNTTPFDRLLAGLGGLGMPRLFVSLLAFAFRYLYVLFDELARMRTAQRARTFVRRPPGAGWKNSVHLVGMLLVRALDRAERIHGAMCSRGWSGKVRTLEPQVKTKS